MSARHTGAAQIASLLPERAHLDRILIAIVDLLSADSVITDVVWCGDADGGDPRIYRLSDAELTPDRRWPLITVAPETRGTPWHLQGDVECSAAVVVRVHYYEPRVELDNTVGAEELSQSSIAHYVFRLLVSTREARGLKVARYGDRPLVSHVQAADINYALVYTGEEHEDGTPVTERVPELTINYKYTIRRDTGQPEGFAPNE